MCGVHLNYFEFTPKDALIMPSLDEIGPLALEMSINNFCYITIISPWKGVVLYLNRLESPSLKNRPHGSGGEIKNVRSLPK